MPSTGPAPSEHLDRVRSSDETGAELKRGAFLNAVAMVTSSLRSIFTILVARLLGPASLGLFSVAWATTELLSKIGIMGLDDAATTFVARANAVGDQVRARALFRIAAIMAVVQSTVVVAVLIFVIRRFGRELRLEPTMISALTVILWAMPPLALYRISVAVSRGMKVMQHDIYSRGVGDSVGITLAFLIAFTVGVGELAPEYAAICGMAAAGLIAFILASRLFRHVPDERRVGSRRAEARRLFAYALPIGADQFLNTYIWRMDVILLGWSVGRVPGVTLTTLGIYGGVVGIAYGLRRVSQAYVPIFAPIVAGMTATGEHKLAIATYGRLAQWMLWILLPFCAVLIFGGETILLVFGPAFQQGSAWLSIVAIAWAANSFIILGETVIMVQRPGLNLLNSLITCAVGSTATFCFIRQFGVMGAAYGILTTCLVQGLIRNIILRFVFRWHNPWTNVAPPILTAAVALLPALAFRALLHGLVAQVTACATFLIIFAMGWRYHRLRSNEARHEL
jgi:O-antigen/teichoic acid export membrane protein